MFNNTEANSMTQVRSIDPAQYTVSTTDAQLTLADDDILALAYAVLKRRLQTPANVFTSPDQVKLFLSVANAGHADQSRERFGVLFLDSQHGLIALETLFEGTLSQTSVYPREVVRRALQLNAAAVILTHNHPSGVVEPSHADVMLTQTLKSALSLVDVRVLDHIITTPGAATCSLAERGQV
jgi:DNA repair protein RadC